MDLNDFFHQVKFFGKSVGNGSPREAAHKIRVFLFHNDLTTTTMASSTRNRAYSETDIQNAISEYKNNKYKSIRSAAIANNVPRRTVQSRLLRLNHGILATNSNRSYHSEEEKTLFKWITQLTCTGLPATPALVVEMANEIRRSRPQLLNQQPQQPNNYPQLAKTGFIDLKTDGQI